MSCIPVYHDDIETVEFTPDEIQVQLYTCSDPIVYRLRGDCIEWDDETEETQEHPTRIKTTVTRFDRIAVFEILEKLRFNV